MKDKINPNLRKLAELTHNPDLELPDLEEIVKEVQTPIQTNQLKKDENGRPIIKLTPLEKTAVHTPTQESYDTLMQVYECGGWKWSNGKLPTSEDYWEDEKEKTCVDAEFLGGGGFRYSSKDYNLAINWNILQPQEFYNKQNITDAQIKEINEYFENER